MKFDDALMEGDKTVDSIQLLESIDPATATCEELRKLVVHLKKQFKECYKYLVGEWSSTRRAKSTQNGKFVKRDEVIDYPGSAPHKEE